jgi:hypothetical protein
MPFSQTVSDYARHRGCDEKAVRKAIDEGRITAIGEGRARRIDPAVADIQWAQNTRARADSARKPTAAPAPAADVPPAPADYNDHRTRRERAEADMAELERDRQAGNLVRREAAERAVFEAFRALRDACMQSHLGTAQKLLNLADAREVRFILDDGYRAAFENAERTVAQLLAGVAKP